ncbi:MAG: hypothetical protein ISR69_00645 [Gammaproteobacteria bacterium]|nr:hypothetical protein [Gammaproteobacteria bacterium]
MKNANDQKHIVLAWELGSNYGHLSKMLTLTRPFISKGYKVSFILRDLSHVQQLGVPDNINIYQSPFISGKQSAQYAPTNYSDILLGVGYSDLNKFVGALRGWITLFELLKPDLLICDHSPTALLAAKANGCKVVNFGTGFELVDLHEPFASLRLWEKVPQSSLVAADQSLLIKINKALKLNQKKGYSNLKSAFTVDQSYLCTLPELDPYIGRKNTPYWGPLMEMGSGVTPVWPKQDGFKVFVYVRPDIKIMLHLIKAMMSLNLSVLIHCIGGYTPKIDGIQNLENIHICEKPLNMSEIVKQADLILCHGGHGTVANALLAGIPLLLFPTQQEQKNTAVRLTNLGVALELKGQESQQQLKKKLNSFIKQEQFKSNMNVLKDKYQDFNITELVEDISQRCIDLCEEKNE